MHYEKLNLLSKLISNFYIQLRSTTKAKLTNKDCLIWYKDVCQGNRKHNGNNATLGTGSRRRDDDVITGSGRNFDICSSGHQRRRSDLKYREVIGVFVSRLQRNTRAADIERHVSRVFGLRLKCDPVPTKFDTYTSYHKRASTREIKTLLNSNKWPENVLVKEYYKVIY